MVSAYFKKKNMFKKHRNMYFINFLDKFIQKTKFRQAEKGTRTKGKER